MNRVYPRVYGETGAGDDLSTQFEGLSPRVRGNRVYHVGTELRVGSIPACTGKPQPDAGGRRVSEVYPRVYGETFLSAAIWNRRKGLSPRVRGNLWVIMTHTHRDMI